MMLGAQRRAVVADHVRLRGGIRVSELAAMLGVSQATVRRDLRLLAICGELERVHDGAVAVSLVSQLRPSSRSRLRRSPLA